MPKLNNSINISAPVEKVFAYVTELNKEGRFCDFVFGALVPIGLSLW